MEQYLAFFDALNKIGPFVSGVSLLIAALAAWVTLLLFHKRTLDINWIAGIRILYADFWDDTRMANVRVWLSSEKEYSIISEILIKRLTYKHNDLSLDENIKLDQIDRLCSFMARIAIFGRIPMTTKQRELYDSLYVYWADVLQSREELFEYIQRYWPDLTKWMQQQNALRRGQLDIGRIR